MTMFSELRNAMAKRAAYNRTVRELRDMPAELARDLDIDPSDASRIARRAVYGL